MASMKATPPRPVRPPRSWKEVAKMGGFHREVGLSIDPKGTSPGVCTVVGTIEPRHLNINGVVHGGVYATILDTAMGGAVVTRLADDETTATTSLYVEFLRPAVAGQHLRAKGEVVRRGRHLAFVRGDLMDSSGGLLALAHGTWYIWASGDTTWQGASPAQKPPAADARRADRGRAPSGG